MADEAENVVGKPPPRRPPVVYENSDQFLKLKSEDPFGQDFEKSLEDAPVVQTVARQISSTSASSASTDTSGNSSNSSSNPPPFAPPPKKKGSSGKASKTSSVSSYDEMSINSGRPVILSSTTVSEVTDSLTAINFGSPLRDVESRENSAVPPVPAPRISKMASLPESEKIEEDNNNVEECGDEDTLDEDEEDDSNVIYEELVPPSTLPPPPPPRSESPASADNLYSELTPPVIDTTVDSAFASKPTNILDRSNEDLAVEAATTDTEEEADGLADLPDASHGSASKLLNPKLTTIDIRQDVNKLWEEAVRELESDQKLVEYIEERESTSTAPPRPSTNSYDSVAMPEARFKIVNGVQVPIPVTLLKDFDPMFDKKKELAEEGNDSDSASTSRSSSQSKLDTVPEGESEADERDMTRPPVPLPRRSVQSSTTTTETNSGESKTSSVVEGDDEVFSSATTAADSGASPSLPPLPPPPSSTKRPTPYENVYVSSEAGAVPKLASSETAKGAESDSERAVPPTLPRRNENFYASVGGAAALPPSDSSGGEADNLKSNGDDTELKTTPVGPSPVPPALRSVSRSSSASNLANIARKAKKLSFIKLGRKISFGDSDPTTAAGGGSPVTPLPAMSGSYIAGSGARRRSSNGSFMLDPSWATGTKNHSGPLFIWSRAAKYSEKWCVLGNANLRYFNQKDSMAEPKEMILLKDVLSINKRETSEGNEEAGERTLYLFDVAFVASNSKKLSIRTFGAASRNVRDVWIDKLAQSLSRRLDSFSMSYGDCSKLGWVYLKVMFAGEWHQSWISLRGSHDFYYTVKETEGGPGEEKVDLKRTKNVTLVKEIKNLGAPESNLPVLVVDLIDRSLYMQSRSEKETLHWKSMIESVAFNNGASLDEQQLTKDGIPVVVEQCVNFVFRHGCMTEGIYRHSGVKTKIDRLLKEFGANAWAVQMTREAYSEHDVANALKRFMRTLDEPLLPDRQKWMEAASSGFGPGEKMRSYSVLLSRLPAINRRTLRRLIGHLRAVSNQCERNLMPNYNLAAIWGPTLLTVDGQSAPSDFGQTSGEADVCKDLIDNYRDLFNVTREEIDREEEIMRKTESFNKNPNPVKISGEVMMFVHIDTKTGDDCVSIAVTPKMSAHELHSKALKKAAYSGDSSKFLLHEVILGGEMERVIHYNEVIYDVTLKWWQWAEEDRRNTYLLLKRNTFFEEAVPAAVPPLSVFGEALYGANSKGSKFKRFLFSMNNAKITRSKESGSGKDGAGGTGSGGTAVEVETWDIERIIWYFGCENKRLPPSNLNVTFIERDVPVERSKERPHFGRTISFASRELFIKWVAAMLVAEHQTDIVPPETLLNIEDEE